MSRTHDIWIALLNGVPEEQLQKTRCIFGAGNINSRNLLARKEVIACFQYAVLEDERRANQGKGAKLGSLLKEIVVSV